MDQGITAPLRFGLSERIIQSLTEVFSRFPEVEEVLVHGSRATGGYKPHSDIDLAVIAPAMTEREFSRLWNMLDDLPILFKLDVVLFEQVTRPALKQNIQDKGVPLYRRADLDQPGPGEPGDPGRTGTVR
ncbi:nucleotidyltransferase domain-containing protein [Pseudoduganella namucuonensis]|uniref:Proline iminopeptidase n=1 Tax=Pseudoduganella namucuonensis TaxID=1035707 RepID=A0A1I7LVN1_9BURK|nr:nucleotidyltransferase domain-containing protein [Pseudoduganella namucuonensis]SFV13630.1 proline iminopeptidase [Pseudoduganella namucuonensis]